MLVETAGPRQLVTHPCDRAAASGARPGMTLAQARALCPGLADAPHDPALDARALTGLGRWLTRFTPAVSPAPPDGLFLDVGGCERLYGGLGVLLARVAGALDGLKLDARVAIAPTPGAAWAIASADPAGHGRIVPPDELATALAPLPPAALRLDPATVALLDQLGVRAVAQLAELPRDALPARFGAGLLRRLDAALGRIAEPLTPLAYRATIEAGMASDDAVTSLEAIWQAFGHLVEQVVPALARRGCGARHVRVELRRAHAPPLVRTIRLSRPSRDPAVLLDLLRCATERLDGVDDGGGEGEGFVGVRLAVPVAEPVTDDQLALLGDAREDRAAGEQLARLIDRLCGRLGRGAVARPERVASHLPERAYRLVEPGVAAIAPRPPRRTLLTGHADADDDDVVTTGGARPLRLLPVPVEVAAVASPSYDAAGPPLSFTHGGAVHRLAHAAGPERICGAWWEGRHKTRDYFDAQDEAGRRFWLFRVRQTGKWYLHGVFE